MGGDVKRVKINFIFFNPFQQRLSVHNIFCEAWSAADSDFSMFAYVVVIGGITTGAVEHPALSEEENEM